MPQMEFSEEYEEEINRILHELQSGDLIRVLYYTQNTYQCLQGMIKKIDVSGQFLMVEDTKIPFTRIYKILRNF